MKKSTLLLPAVLLSTMVILGGCGDTTEKKAEIIQESGTETVMTDSSGDAVVSGTTSLKDEGYFKELITNGKDPKIKDIISYNTAYKNSDWNNLTLNIDHVKIVNVDDFSDSDGNEYKELMTLKYQMINENSTDTHIEPDSASLILDNGEKVSAEFFFDYWDDEILTHDEHKDGMLHFKVKESHELKNISKIEITFKAKNDTSNEETHTYTIDKLEVE